MKQNVLLITAAVMFAGGLTLSAQSAGKWQRMPERPGRVESPQRLQLRPERPDPGMEAERPAQGTAVFSEEESTPLARRMAQTPSPRKAKSANEIIGEIYGVINNFNGMGSDGYNNAGWAKIEFEDFSVTPLFTGSNFCNTMDQINQTGAVRDGILYIPEGTRSSVRDFEVIWKRFDLNQGKWLEPLRCADDPSLWMMSMCYDPVTDAFYGMSGLAEGSGLRYGRIVRVDLDPVSGQPKATILRDNPETAQAYSGFYYDPSTQQIKVFTDNHQLNIFNRETGQLVTDLELSCENYEDEAMIFSGFDNRGTAHLVYSPRDQKVLMMVPDMSAQLHTYIYSFENDEGILVREGEIEGGYYLTALYTPDTYADPEAAGQVKIQKVNLSGNSLSGSIDLLVPDTHYNGLALSGTVKLIVEADGNSLYNADAKAGSTVNVPFTLTEGLHKIKVRADLPNFKGPDISTKFYVGNDTPLRPTDVAVNGNTVSWTAPGAVGFNGGYVDVADLSYDVYFGTRKLNASPIKGTTYTFTPPTELQRVDLTVTATSHGKTSLASEAVNFVTGSSLGLPYTATPDKKQADLFTIVDANRDGARFVYEPSEKEFQLSYETYENANDWLILPALYISEPDKMHKFAVDFRTVTPYYGTESVELCIGTSTNPSAMRKIIGFDELQTADIKYLHLDGMFNVDKAGTYYLAVHSHTTGTGAGSRLANFKVEALESSTQVPSAATDFQIIPAGYGDLSATLKVKVPTTDAAGKALATGNDVTVNVRNFDQNAAHTGTAKGKPGSTVEVACPSNQGFNTYLVVCSNEHGEGASSIGRAYVGIDTPKIVENLRHTTSEDNMTMTLSWDPVTEGINGGFIDPDNLTYQVWYNPQGVTWQRVGDPVKETSVQFNPGYNELARYRVSVFAQNSIGFLKAQTVEHVEEEILGKPIEFPFRERFGTAGADYRWFYNRRTPETENSQIRQILNDEASLLGIGNPAFEDGSGRLISNYLVGQACKAVMYVPKFSTFGQVNPTFRMRYWCHASAPTFKIMARKYGQETPKEIYSWEPDAAKLRTWDEIMFELPEEYQNEKWVQFIIHFDIPRSQTGFGLIDSMEVFSMVDRDMKATSVKCEAITHVGDDCTFEATFTNAGQERMRTPLYAEVIADGKVIDQQTQSMRALCASLNSYTARFTFTAKPDYLNYKNVKVRFYVDPEGDAIPSNNSMEQEWQIVASVLPLVTDLRGDVSDDKTQLSWTSPRHPYGSFEDFEFMQPFEYGEKFGQWTNLNRDNLQNFVITGFTEAQWPAIGVKKGWQVINDVKLGTKGDISLGAHSGDQFILAMAGYDENDESGQLKQVSDWLISPEVVGGTRVKFWVNIVDPTYRETLHIYYSTTDNKPESFIKLCNRSKEGSAGWEQTYFDLPADAKYFAMEYVGWGTFGIGIDDLEYVPAKPDYWTIESFDVYKMKASEKEYTKLGNTVAPAFSEAYDGTDSYYFVKCQASYNGIKREGPASNVIMVGPSGITNVETLEGVYGGKASIVFKGHEGREARIFTTEGKLQRAVRIDGSAMTLPTERGLYIVMIDGKATKVIVE